MASSAAESLCQGNKVQEAVGYCCWTYFCIGLWEQLGGKCNVAPSGWVSGFDSVGFHRKISASMVVNLRCPSDCDVKWMSPLGERSEET